MGVRDAFVSVSHDHMKLWRIIFMEISSWKAFPIALAVAALFIFGIGAACAVTPEDDFGGGGTESDTFIPEGGSDTFIPEGGSDTIIPEDGSDTIIPEDGSDTIIPEGGSDTIIPEGSDTIDSLMQGTVDSIDADAGQMVLALTGSESVDINLDQNTMVTVNGAPGLPQDLQPGDSVQVEVDQNTNVATSVIVLSQAMDTNTLPQTQQGTVESVDADAGQISLALAGGDTIDVNVDQSTLVTVNGAPGLLQDLQPGDSVEVEVDQETDLATFISVGTGVGTEPVTTTGEIDEIDLTSQSMTLVTPEGETLSLSFLQLDGSTEIIVEGSQGTLLDLVSGASVEVTYDPDTMEIDTVYVRTG
jgi:Cu/Ag efflux protein CusF